MLLLRKQRDPVSGEQRPTYIRRYRVTSVPTSSARGHWFMPKFHDAGWASESEFVAAKALKEIVARDAQRIEAPTNLMS
jgi:hypothetical protein